MAIPPKVSEPAILLNRFKETFARTLGITDFTSDSKYRILTQPVANVVAELTQNNLAYFDARNISSATGKDLDALAIEIMGTGRRASTKASASRESRNVVFYVTSGTFGELFPGSSYSIPAGTKVFSDVNQNQQNLALNFVLAEQVVLEAASSVAFVSVVAEIAGRSHNVGVNVIRNHSVGITGLKVTNFQSILNGSERETDEQLRFRVSRYSSSLIARNDDSILLDSLSVPGVISTRSISGYFGPGSCAVVVLCTDYESNLDTIRSVQTRLDTQRVPGLYIVATPAVKNQLSLEVRLEIKSGVSAQQKIKIESDIVNELRNILREVGLGGTVERSALEAVIKEKSAPILARPTVKKDRIESLFSSRSTISKYFTSKQIEGTRIILEEDEYSDIQNLTVTYTEVS